MIYGNADTWFEGLTTKAERCERAAKRISEFLKVSKDCGFDAGCFSSAPLLSENGEEYFENYLETLQVDNLYMVSLQDGISLAFFGTGSYIIVKVDIDGPNKGKNQEGNDLFHFYFGLNNNDKYYLQLIPDIKVDVNGNWIGDYQLTTKWVIENGNLDYLKCPDELNWETKTSCE